MAEATELTVNGMTLTQYAFVRAGLAEGLPVEEVLGFLHLDAAAWEGAEEAWDERILDAVGEVDADVLDQLAAKTAEARTHWTRRVPPLDEDLRAWFAFLHAWKNDAEPVEFLRRMNVATADVAYLHRLWSERMMKDPKLRDEALTMLGEELGEPPVPAPELPRLRNRKPREAAPDGDNATQELSFAKGRTLPFAEGEPAPMPPPLAVPLPQRKRPHTTAPGVEETAVLRVASTEAALPFGPAEIDANLRISMPRQADVEPRVSDSDPGGMVLSTAPKGAAVTLSLGGDARSLITPALDAVLFASSGDDYCPFDAAPEPSRTGSLERATLRVEVIEPSPFDDAPESAAPDPPSSAMAGGDTAPLGPIVTGSVLPFASIARAATLAVISADETVAINIATRTLLPMTAAFGSTPRLSLEQYAWLSAELTTAKEQSAAILERHGLTPETKKAEDSYWRAELTHAPEKHALWLRLCAAALAELLKGNDTL